MTKRTGLEPAEELTPIQAEAVLIDGIEDTYNSRINPDNWAWQLVQVPTLGQMAWSINGDRNRAFPVTITAIDADIITAQPHGLKTYDRVFDRKTGLAVSDYQFKRRLPLLVDGRDANAIMLDRHKRRGEFRARIDAFANAMRWEPSQEAADALADLIQKWAKFEGLTIEKDEK